MSNISMSESPTRGEPARRRLTEIANEAGTDKGTVCGDAHGYTLIYELLFDPIRDQALNLLEVGLSIGGPEHDRPASRTVADAPSIRMWNRYFPNAKLFGVDISDFSAFETDRFKFYEADCGDVASLDRLVDELTGSGVTLDIIIDDASHASFHQQMTMLKLFPLLKEGGFYVVEDLNWQPKRYEALLPKVPKTSTLLVALLARGCVQNTGSISEDSWRSVVSRMASTILIDEDYLLHLRRGYNLRSGSRSRQASYLESSIPKRLLHRRNLRHIYEQIFRTAQIVTTGAGSICAGRIALAVIQKH